MQLVLFSFYGSGNWDVVFMVWLCQNEQENQILLNLTQDKSPLLSVSVSRLLYQVFLH